MPSCWSLMAVGGCVASMSTASAGRPISTTAARTAARAAWCMGTLVIVECSRSVPLRHFFQHHLGGAAADGQDACIAPQPLDRRLAHVAHAAMELLAGVHHL